MAIESNKIGYRQEIIKYENQLNLDFVELSAYN